MSVVPDLTFGRERILIQVDSWAWHHSPAGGSPEDQESQSSNLRPDSFS